MLYAFGSVLLDKRIRQFDTMQEELSVALHSD
jgi:hypothetical protein